jgi:hypothetical protein
MNTIETLAKQSSRNHVPALFKKIDWEPSTRNLDLGGGAYETATEWLAERGVCNLIIDPYNRSELHNFKMRNIAFNLPLHSVTLANVLNVIPDRDKRLEVLSHARSYHRRHECPVYISCYNASGQPSVSECQTRMSLKDYIPEIKEVFGDAEVTIQNNYITIV